MEGPAQDSAAAPPSWSEQELWVWSQLTQGLPANFNTAQGYGGDLDPRKAESWPARRTLSPQFLQAILFAKQNQEALTWHGVQIEGARFEKPVDLSNGRLACVLVLYRCRFDGGIACSRLDSTRVISLRGSKCIGDADLSDMHVEDDLLIGGQAEYGSLNLASTRVAGDLDLADASVAGALNLNSARVERDLVMRGHASFAEVSILNANIGGLADLSGAKFSGKVNLNGVHVEHHLFMKDGCHFSRDVELTGARIGGQIGLSDSRVDGELNIGSAGVGGSILLGKAESSRGEFHSVYLGNATVGGQVDARRIVVKRALVLGSARITGGVFLSDCPSITGLDVHGANIGGQLDLSNSSFHGDLLMENVEIGRYLLMLDAKVESGEIALKFARMAAVNFSGCSISATVDLSGATIAGELRVGQTGYANGWSAGSLLTLRNASAAALHDAENSWPPQLDLTGFTYERLGATEFGKSSDSEILGRSVDWFKGWLTRQPRYSPQPYEQLAEVLVTAGAREKADAILYEGRDRERRETLRGAPWLWATALDLFIGYGYYSLSRIFFIWLPVFTLAGMLALTIAIGTGTLDATFASDFPARYFDDFGHRFSYSLDKFLPVMKLRDYHYSKIRLDGWLGYYFDFQQFMGYFLGSMLVAGITGIAKRSHA